MKVRPVCMTSYNCLKFCMYVTSPSPELHLVPLEVGLVLHYFYKSLRDNTSQLKVKHFRDSTYRHKTKLSFCYNEN